MEPGDLKSYSLASKQCRWNALEHLKFKVHDCDSVKRAEHAGARKFALTLIDDVLMRVDLNKVVNCTTKDCATLGICNIFKFINLKMNIFFFTKIQIYNKYS